MIWHASYTGPGNNPDAGFDLALNNSGDLFVTGRSYPVGNVQDFVTIKYSQTIGIQQISGSIPDNYALSQNYPNPFNPATKIDFDLPSSGFVKLKVFDINGKEVQTLVNESLTTGKYSIDFDAGRLSSGVYFYRMETPGFVMTKKMIVMK